MKVMEKFGVPEPQWMLDRLESGPMYWRRQSATAGNNPRVKFRCDVEVKEFSRGDHEFDEFLSDLKEELQPSSSLSLGMTAIFCVMVTLFLPWYLIGVK